MFNVAEIISDVVTYEIKHWNNFEIIADVVACEIEKWNNHQIISVLYLFQWLHVGADDQSSLHCVVELKQRKS